MIEFLDIHKRYSSKVMALERVNLELPEGIFCLLGPNGAGKTTLIKIACGVLLPDQGDVLFCGRSILKATKALWGLRGV